ncbi:ELWxxDGT repeat protein [Lewinella aquimaris]|uniref:ELWxxDGT repeat protein n=1 Tax=Neolewinella aquimaris TaxID=1835722 RepID=A0A840E242_9BACT|nr:T9SS type A sorting domain-containing protein [Neolewinella aquimaris]MBB4078023.1 ELWxxDGT repeat protein [Neolewinella aquimaris]
MFVALFTFLYGQFPAFTDGVIDMNQRPRLRAHFGVPNFYPGDAPGSFYYSFRDFDPNGIFYFDGRQLDTVVADAGLNGRISGRYAGGLMLYRGEGTWNTEFTYHLDPTTFDTTRLVEGRLQHLHTFADGRKLLEDRMRLFAIGNDPSSLRELPRGMGAGSPLYTTLGDSFVYVTLGGLAITDGTSDGTRLLYEDRNNLTQLIPSGERIYFANYNRELYVSDGTVDGTRQISFDHLPEERRPYFTGTKLYVVRGALLFNAFLANGERELWRTDGTPEGTYALAAANPVQSISTDSFLIFRAGSPDSPQLWSSTGDSLGTQLLVDLTGREISYDKWGVQHIAQLEDGSLYFSTNESYKDDSFYFLSPTGELERIDVPIDKSGNAPTYLPTATQLFVINRRSDKGLYVHRRGTEKLDMLAPFTQLTGSIKLDEGIVVTAAGKFGGINEDVAIVYYKNSVRIYPTFQSATADTGWPSLETGAFVQSGDRLYGIGVDEAVGEAILSFNLLNGETQIYQDLYPHTGSATVDGLRAGGDAAYFVHGEVVYGSATGCQYEPLFAGDASLRVSSLEGTDRSVVYGSRNNKAYYFTDGTKAGTRKLPPLAYPAKSPLQTFGDHFYYLSGEDGSGNLPGRFRLIRLDGQTGEATEVISVDGGPGRIPHGYYLKPIIASTGTALYFPCYNQGNWEIWRSDGSSAGTNYYADFSGIGPNLFPYEMTGSVGVVSFRLADADRAAEIAGSYYIREGEDMLPINTNSSWFWFSPVHIAGTTYYTDRDTLFRVPTGSRTAQPFVEMTGKGIQELTTVDDTTLIFTTFNYGASLWRVHLPTGEVTRLIGGLDREIVFPKSNLTVLDSLVFILQESGVRNRPQVVNVHTGDVLQPYLSKYEVSAIVRAGNRFVYISGGSIYGREVYVLDFGQHSQGKPTAVVETRPDKLPISLYPNPIASGRPLQIELPATDRYRYQLLSSDGRAVQSGNFIGSTTSINTAGLSPGVYFLRIRGGSSRVGGTVRVLIVGG